jgi:beta-aspartyl-peptidase (threonine type)
VIVHGGAGAVEPERVFQKMFIRDKNLNCHFQWAGKYKGVILASQIGYNVLKNGGSSLDAVEAAIRSLEVDPYFNAGKF